MPWAAVGMGAGDDYADLALAHADVVSTGWYTWDVTSLVRGWVRGEAAQLSA